MVKHEHPVEGGPNPCFNCPPIPTQATMDKLVCVGFGCAEATKDGELVADGERGIIIRNGIEEETEDYIRFADIEAMAAIEPDHDWRIKLHGPMHGETYQRQGPEQWVCIERNEGFA